MAREKEDRRSRFRFVQSMLVMLPEIGTRFAGSAGGVVSEVSLLMTFALPIAISAAAGASYELNFALSSACFACAIIPVLLIRVPSAAARDDSDRRR